MRLLPSASAAVVRRLGMSVAVLLLLGQLPVRAQSPLVLENIGADIRLGDAASEGRGGWGLSVRDTLAPSLNNPASLAGQRNVVLLAAGYGEHLTSQELGRKRTTNTTRTPTLGVVVPAAAGRLVFSAALLGLRATQYERLTSRDGVLLDPDSPDDTVAVFTALTRFTREGTQFRVPLGVSVRLSDALSAAASLNIENGVFRERAADVYVEPLDPQGNPLLLPSSEYLEDNLDGTSTTWSLLWTPGARFALGTVFTPAHDWDMTRIRDMTGLPGRVTSSYGIHLPAAYAAGLSWQWNGRWRLGLEGEYQDFGSFSGRDDWASAMTQAWRFSAGIERREAFRRRAGTGNLPLRCGVSVRQWPYRFRGAAIRETRLSVGTGVPLHQRRGHLDVALGYGWRGDDATGIKDHYWRFSVSVAGLERWW